MKQIFLTLLFVLASNVQAAQENTGSIEIVVTDADTNSPIEGATVYIRSESAGRLIMGTSNKDGIVKFTVPEGKYSTNSAYKFGFTNWVQEIPITVEKDKTARIEIQFSSPKKIKAMVKDESGNPLEGVKVQISPRFTLAEPVSDAGGQVEFPGLEQYRAVGQQIILFARDENRNLAGLAEFEKSGKTIEIIVKPAVIVTGKVVDSAQKPVGGADVIIRCEGLLISTEPNKTNKEGKFTIKALPAQTTLYVFASAEDYGPSSLIIDRAVIENNFYDTNEIELIEANMAISGIVIDANDNPIAKVGIYSAGPEGQPSRSTITDNDGKFTLNKLCPGKVRLSVSPTESYNGCIIWAQAGSADVRVVLRPRGVFRITPQQPVTMVGKSLSDLKNMGIKIPPADTNDKMVLLCFFNKQQRSSIFTINEMARLSEELNRKGIVTAFVEVSRIDENTLLKWGVQSLPWLALTDKKNVVRIEGFTLNELNTMIKQMGGKKETLIVMQF